MLAWAVLRYVTMDASQEQVPNVHCTFLFSHVKHFFVVDALVLAQVYAVKLLLTGLLRASHASGMVKIRI